MSNLKFYYLLEIRYSTVVYFELFAGTMMTKISGVTPLLMIGPKKWQV